jgi:NAD-dependent dihydropyrimidine dehydrogenase PreA subunit/flavodoxin
MNSLGVGSVSNKKIRTLYFSATGTTEKVVTGIANKLSRNIGKTVTVENFNFTLPEFRKNAVSFTDRDLVIVGVPVIAGRVPNILLKYLNAITGNGALVVSVVVYGNRNYDDALIELKDILESRGFRVIAGGAFIGEHSFSKSLGKDRPDEQDMAVVTDFAEQIYEKITIQGEIQIAVVFGNKPYRDYYKPQDTAGNPVDFRKIVPKTNSDCIDCKLCASICPMGSIASEDVSRIVGICIKCCACVKKCPVQAKYFDDEHFLRHKNELEIAFSSRREPELFL